MAKGRKGRSTKTQHTKVKNSNSPTKKVAGRSTRNKA